MMLSDEEIIQIAAETKTGEPGLHGYILPISFAREIERAVLAKASQQVHGKNVAHDIKITVESLIESARCMGALSQDKDAHAYWINKTEEYRKKVYAIIESSKAMPAPKQEPIYQYSNMHNLSLWTDCNKETYEIMRSEFKRIVYLYPAPPQAAAIPEGYVHVDEVIQLCRDFSTMSGGVYIGDVEAALSGLSAAPKPEGE